MSLDHPTFDVPIPRDQLLDRAAARHLSLTARPAERAVIAPGRINLIGEHTDYNDGFVMPLAIDRWIIATVSRRPDRTVMLDSDATDEAGTLDLSGDLSRPAGDHARWSHGPRGIIHLCRERGVDIPGLDITFTSSLPVGGGLSSSAALLVATLMVIESVSDLTLDSVTRARLCQTAEHDFMGTPCGIMDPLASLDGRAGHAMLLDCRSSEYDHFTLPDLDIIAVDTGVRHDLATSEYGERRRTCELAAERLRLPSLRDATLAMIASASLPSTEASRASHVITENTRVLLAARALQGGDLSTLGDLMFASHESLRDLYAVSCPELDCVVDTAAAFGRDTVHGARMTGGGFGGSVIMLIARDARESICQTIHGRYVEAFGTAPTFRHVSAVDGACVVGLV